MITVTPTPIEAFPINRTPFSNMVPFTYWDHATNADILTRLRHWLYNDFTNWVNENFENAAEQWNEEIRLLIEKVNEALENQSDQTNDAIDELREFVIDTVNDLTDYVNISLNAQDAENDVKIAALTAYVNLKVQQIIDAAIEVSDPVIAGVLNGLPTNETNVTLDGRYVRQDKLDDKVADLFTGGGDARDAADARYITKVLQLTTKRLLFETGKPIVLEFAGATRVVTVIGNMWREYFGNVSVTRGRNNSYIDTGIGGSIPRPILSDTGKFTKDYTTEHMGYATPNAQGIATITLPAVTNVGMRTMKVSDGITEFTFDIGIIGPRPAAIPGKPYGFGIALQSRDDQDLNIKTLADVGVGFARHELSWSTVETVKGQYAIPSWYPERLASLAANGIKSLIIGNYQNALYASVNTPEGALAFAKYFEFVLNNTPGIEYAELYNEWELGGPVGAKAGADYALFCQRVYTYLKPRFPWVYFIGGFAQPRPGQPVWTDFIAAGGLTYLDGISLHYYQSTTFDVTQNMTNWEAARTAANKGPMKYFMTEWNTYQALNRPAPDDQTQYRNGWGLNAHLVSTYAGENSIESFMFYNAMDDGRIPGSREGHFGMFKAPTERVKGYQPKAIAVQAWQVRNLLGRYQKTPETVNNGSMLVHTFTNDAGKKVWIFQRVGGIPHWVEDTSPYRATYPYTFAAGNYVIEDFDQPYTGNQVLVSSGAATSLLVGQNILVVREA